MFKRKLDLDKHVTSVLSRKKNHRERSILGLQIARLYSEIHEYSTAKMYLSSYLKFQETVPQAYQLMGEVNEALGLKEEAVNSYRRALDLGCFGVAQEHLVTKICELYCEIGMDDEKLKYCIEKCEVMLTNSDAIKRIKKNISSDVHLPVQKSEDESDGNIEHSVIERCVSNTLKHPQLSVISLNKSVKDAYTTALEYNLNEECYSCVDWNTSALHVFEEYRRLYPECKTELEFNLHLLHILRNLLYYSIACKCITEVSQFLMRFDQHLKYCDSLPYVEETWTALLTEMKGQLLYIAGLLLLKKAYSDLLTWKEALHYVEVCFMACETVLPIDNQTKCFSITPDKLTKLCKWWNLQSYDRLSQVGHMLIQFSFAESFTGIECPSTIVPIKCSVCKEVYSSLEQEELEKTFLYNQIVGSSDLSCILSEDQLIDIDKVAIEIHLSSLPHIVWLCLQHYTIEKDVQPNYNFIPLESSFFKTRYLPQASDDKLSNLDMFVFLLSSVRCASGIIWSRNNTFYENEPSCPILLPVIINSPFCTHLQEQWWSAAYKFCTHHDKDVTSKLWPVIKQGVETVRLAGSHGISLMMSAHIAKCLDAKVKNLVEIGLNGNYSTSDLIALEEKAAFYWKQTKQALENIHRDGPLVNQRLFVEKGDENIPIHLLASITEEAKFAMACINLKSNQLMTALQTFTSLNSLWAKYFMAKIYRKLAHFEDETDENVKKALLLRAEHCLKDVIENNHTNNCFKLEVLSSKELEELNEEIIKLCDGGSVIGPSNNYSSKDQESLNHAPVISVTPAFNIHSQHTITDKSAVKSGSHIEGMMLKLLLENNYSLIQQNGKLMEHHHQMKHDLKEKDFCIEKLKNELMATNLLHSLQ